MRRGLWSRQHAMRCSVHSRASSVERYPVEGRAPGSAPAPAGRTSPSEVEVGAEADRRGASPPSVSLGDFLCVHVSNTIVNVRSPSRRRRHAQIQIVKNDKYSRHACRMPRRRSLRRATRRGGDSLPIARSNFTRTEDTRARGVLVVNISSYLRPYLVIFAPLSPKFST